MSLANHVLHSVRGAGANLQHSVQQLGRGIDKAVRAGIGVSPSSLFSTALRAMGSGNSAAEAALISALHEAGGAPPAPGPRASAWTKVCVQQADLCLLVG